jgi:glucokinase
MKKDPTYILAGDIGGTKTNLGLYTSGKTGPTVYATYTYSSPDANGLEEMIAEMLQQHPVPVAAACFGIACPVMDGECQPTNLSWAVSEKKLRRQFGWDRVQILNDLSATAFAVPLLGPQELFSLNRPRHRKAGNMVLVAPGTGLGQALLLHDHGRYLPMASEGGHADFAPSDEAEVDLWRFLHQRFGHVSEERVLSGQGLVNIYDWLASTHAPEASSRIRQAMGTSDPAVIITENAISGNDPLCRAALKRFCRIFGAVAGNLALTGMATGGVFLGGGIPPKILHILQKPDFMDSFIAKGRFSKFLAAIPVRVICNDKAALIGAAQRALELSAPKGENHDK